jgi:hypothetical protein
MMKIMPSINPNFATTSSMMSKTYPVVLFQEDGSHKVLGVYENYDDADRAVDNYSDMYPNGFVDLLVG